MKIRSLRPVLLALAAFLLVACNTIEGAGKDIRKAGEAVERAASGAKKG